MILVLDFETYYSQTYSLSKITTEAYIRDKQFEVIGVSVKVDDQPAEWFSGTKEEIKEFLDQYDWKNAVAVAHNAMFDMSILNWHFDIRPGRIADTLSMARAVHGPGVSVALGKLSEFHEIGVKGGAVLTYIGFKRADFGPHALKVYGEYCCNDVELTYKLFEIFMNGFPVSELKLIDLTIRMFSEPVLKLDQTVLDKHLLNVQNRKAKLLGKVTASKADLMSNQKFAETLRNFNVEPPTKISKTTGRETLAFGKTDEEFIKLLEHDDINVQTLVAARLGIKSTLEETRTRRFIEIADRGTLPIPLSYYAAHTGRWGGADKINLQNLPRNSALKNAIVPPPGFVFCDSDSSQIEARVLAWLSGQYDLVQAFDEGRDVYKIMASAIFNKSVADITAAERFIGKTVVLGCGYGLGHKRFMTHMKTVGVVMEEDEAKRIIDTYRETYPCIPQLWAQGNDVLAALIGDRTTPFGEAEALAVEGIKGIRLPNGFYLKYPNLRWVEPTPGAKPQYTYDAKKFKTTVAKTIWGGALVENVCQALARIVIGEQMLKVNRKYKVVMTVHDAIGCLIPEREADTGREYVELCMRLRPQWATELPLNCEAGTGLTYGDC